LKLKHRSPFKGSTAATHRDGDKGRWRERERERERTVEKGG